MNIRNTLIPLFILSLALHVNQSAAATTVYHWADEEGLVHFSDVPPEDTSVFETREIKFDSFVENTPDPDRYSIINQADRMAEWRRQITEERLAMKRLQLEEKRLALEQEQSRLNGMYSTQGYYRSNPYYYTAYPQPYYYPYRQYNYHHKRHAYHQPGYHHSFRKGHRDGFSGGHLRFKSPHLKVGIRF
jgi:hypothetical protein